MTDNHIAFGKGSSGVVFIKNKNYIRLESLFGILCGNNGTASGPARTQEPGIIRTDSGFWEGQEIRCVDLSIAENSLKATYRPEESGLKMESVWSFDTTGPVLSRTDTLINDSDKPVTVIQWFLRTCFQPSSYDLYTQSSRWASENQGRWTAAHSGTLVLGCEAGRTTQGDNPFSCIKDKATGKGVAVHLLPLGNWRMRFATHAANHTLAYLVLETGQADSELAFTLQPGEQWTAPAVLITPLPDGTPESAAPAIQRYALKNLLDNTKKEPLILYNTWQDQWDNLEVPRMRIQLEAAMECGCELFVIDAGWFGKGKGDWFSTVGDWQETEDAAFHGNMLAFANEVRGNGLGFGLWMEPEHFGPKARLRQQHPEWFKGSRNEKPRLDLENSEAAAWLESEMRRLIETYKLAYFKIDFNIELGHDENGTELHAYYRAWYGILDKLRKAYPEVWFEGCASGGMRFELESIRHFDSHFPSDTTNPVDTLRIYQGALLRMAPGRINLWHSLHSIGRTVPMYPDTFAEAPESFVGRPTVGWQPIQYGEMVDLDMAAIIALPGVLGMSGDPAGISTEARARIRAHSSFYKKWRRFISTAHAHLLTPVKPISDRSGWAGIQLCSDTDPASLLFAYRLQDIRSRHDFVLKSLDPGTEYQLSTHPAGSGSTERRMTGSALMSDGLPVILDKPGMATVMTIMPV